MNEINYSVQRTTQKVGFNFKVKQENGVYVAEIQELNISVRAGTEADARAQATEAIKKFFEEAKNNGTLLKVLADLQSKTKPNP